MKKRQYPETLDNLYHKTRNPLFRKVLVLNAGWIPVGYSSVRQTLISMAKGIKYALKIEYPKDNEGNYNFDTPSELYPVNWDQWITLPPREFDLEAIHTSKELIRVPSVIITPSYNKIPKRRIRSTKYNVCERYGWKDVYTGKPLSKHSATLDHYIPVSKGGKSDWSNLVPCSRETNAKKADKTPEEAGLKLRVKILGEPKPIPASVILLKSALQNPDWRHFFFTHKE